LELPPEVCEVHRMKKIEDLAREIMRECEKDGEPITFEDALDMAKMEINARGMSNAGRTISEKSEKKPRTVKISDEKIQIFTEIRDFLLKNYEKVEILKENKLIQVKIGEKVFKIDIIEQRTPKK